MQRCLKILQAQAYLLVVPATSGDVDFEEKFSFGIAFNFLSIELIRKLTTFFVTNTSTSYKHSFKHAIKRGRSCSLV